MDSRSERLAVFGSFSEHDLYQRNRQLVAYMREIYPEHVVVNTQSQDTAHGFTASLSGIRRAGYLLRDCMSLFRACRQVDGASVIFVPYPAYLPLLILGVRRLAGNALVLADAFIELHSTVVEDRRLLKSRSLAERLLILFQRWSLRQADVLLIDTEPHARLLSQRVGSGCPPVKAVPVAIDEAIWRSSPLPLKYGIKELNVLFWGTFIPLHGAHVIIEAAADLQERGAPITFRLIGDGPTADHVAELADHFGLSKFVWTRELVSSDDLLRAAAEAHVLLGVFGSSAKAGKVVPYKVQQALALNRIVITRDSELFQGGNWSEDGLLAIPPEDPAALADILLDVLGRLNEGWLPCPRALYDDNFSAAVVRRALAEAIE